MFAPHDRQAPVQDAKLLLNRHGGLQRRLFLLYPQKRNRTPKAGGDLSCSSPLSVSERAPSLFKGANEFQDMQKTHPFVWGRHRAVSVRLPTTTGGSNYSDGK